MAINIWARLRLTHRYIDDYSHMDKWGKHFGFKVLGGKVIEQGNGYDYLGAIKHRIIGSKTLDQDAQAQALRDYFSHHGCSHEWDCCGCTSQTARVRRIKPGIFSMLISTSRNY